MLGDRGKGSVKDRSHLVTCKRGHASIPFRSARQQSDTTNTRRLGNSRPLSELIRLAEISCKGGRYVGSKA